MFPVPTPRISPLVRQFGQPSAALIALAQTAVLARATEQTLRPRIEALQRQVLQQHEYHVDPRWVGEGMYAVNQTRILEPGNAYEMPTDQLDGYGALCEAAYRAAGYAVPAGQCPLLIAEDERCQAELAFGLGCRELRLPLTPDEVREHGDLWSEFVQQMLSIVLPQKKSADRDPEPGIR